MDLKALIHARANKKTIFDQKRAAYNALAAKVTAGTATADEAASATALDAELDAAETEISDLDAKIARAEKDARRAALSAPAPGNISPNFGAGRPRVEVRDNSPNPATTNGFRSMSEFALAVMRANVEPDPRLFAAPPGTNMVNQGNVGEGFLVPPEYAQSVWDLVFPGYGYDLMDLITPTPTNRNMVQLVKDETTPWGAAGVQAYWRAEAAQFQASRLALTGANIPLQEVYAFAAASQELIDDAPQLNDRLTTKAAMAIRYVVSRAIFQGDGVAKPLGFLSGPATITQAKESGQAAATIVLNNVTKMMTRIPAGSLARSIWLANIEILPQLVQLNIGTWPVWIPSDGGATKSPGGMLFGRPIIFSEQALALGTPGDLCLLDPYGYYLATKASGGIDFAASIHLFFDYNMTAFRWVFRIGGQPLLSAPISPANGSLTKSHFVTIQAR
jgi:HK97 family phage major capsid protein